MCIRDRYCVTNNKLLIDLKSMKLSLQKDEIVQHGQNNKHSSAMSGLCFPRNSTLINIMSTINTYITCND